MSRIYDALKNAETQHLPATPPADIARPQPAADEEGTWRLSQAIDTRLAERPRRIIQIIGCGPGEDAGNVARRLARLSAASLHRPSLLLDPAPPPLAGKPQASHPAVGDLPAVQARAGSAPMPRDENLPYDRQRLIELVGAGTFDPKGLRAIWEGLRQKYELVVIHSPPIGTTLGLALAPTVDGVILVVEAEKTRARRAEAARDALVGGGANVLGVILDKRRYWVPERLWQWL